MPKNLQENPNPTYTISDEVIFLINGKKEAKQLMGNCNFLDRKIKKALVAQRQKLIINGPMVIRLKKVTIPQATHHRIGRPGSTLVHELVAETGFELLLDYAVLLACITGNVEGKITTLAPICDNQYLHAEAKKRWLSRKTRVQHAFNSFLTTADDESVLFGTVEAYDPAKHILNAGSPSTSNAADHGSNVSGKEVVDEHAEVLGI